MFKDEGVLLFVILLPIAYPIVYSWIYNNEVVREVPVVTVDMDHSSESREFIRRFDASPNTHIVYRANNMDEAKDIIAHQHAYGILYFPEDFSKKLNRLEQTTVGVYCDMTLMLAYKNVFQTATAVSQDMGRNLQIKLLQNHTDREDEIATKPLDYEEVPIFNTTGGYGNFILPAVLVLIIQQTLLLGIGLSIGTRRDKYGRMTPPTPLYNSPMAALLGQAATYFCVYAVSSCFVLLGIPRIFSFVSIIYPVDFVLFIIPYIIACIFFAITTMTIIRQREDVFIVVVFTSVPLLFIAGVSWPSTSIPEYWKYVSYAFPSTFGVKSFITMNTMGAHIEDITPNIICLWAQAFVYFICAYVIRRNDTKKPLKKKQQTEK